MPDVRRDRLASGRCIERSAHAFKRGHRIDLDGPRVKLGLDRIAFRRQLRAVPADDMTLPSGAGFLADAISEGKRGMRRERKGGTHWKTDFVAAFTHTDPSL